MRYLIQDKNGKLKYVHSCPLKHSYKQLARISFPNIDKNPINIYTDNKTAVYYSNSTKMPIQQIFGNIASVVSNHEDNVISLPTAKTTIK